MLRFIMNIKAMLNRKSGKEEAACLIGSPQICRVTHDDPEFARQMQLADDIMHDDREVLRALAR